MKENILIESKKYKWFNEITLFICFVALILGLVFASNYHTTGISYSPYLGTYNTVDYYSTDMMIGSILCFTVSGICLILFGMTYGTVLIVTEDGVSGRAIFGKQVNIPMDSLSAVGKLSLWGGVAVCSSGGTVRFLLLKNANEIFEEVERLLRKRNHKEITADNKSSGSSIDDLKKYKDLFDSGIITAEEFEVKKKQILGL